MALETDGSTIGEPKLREEPQAPPGARQGALPGTLPVWGEGPAPMDGKQRVEARREPTGAGGPDAEAASPPAELHSEARILSILSQFAGMQFILASTALVRNKIVALRLGPDGYGEITQIAAVAAVATTLVSFGMGVSLSRNAARCRSVPERQARLATANGIVLALSVVAVATALPLLISGHLLPLAALAASPALVLTALVFIAAIPIEGLKTNYLALLQGVLDVRGLAVRRGAAVLLATLIAVPVVWFFGLVGAAIQSFLLAALVALMLGSRVRTLGYSPLRVRLDKAMVANLGSFGIVSMMSGFAQALSNTAVRTHLIDAAGAAANGLLQAPYSLSITVRGIVLGSIGSLSLATIAARTDRAQVSAAVDRLLNVVVPLAALALALLGLLGAPSLRLLYSEAFTSAATLFPWILAADLLLVFVWVVGAPLLAFGDRVLWLVLDLVHAAARWALAVLLIPHLGSTAVVIAYLVAVALHLALNIGVYRLRYRLDLPARHLVRLLGGMALVALLSITGASTRGSLPMVLTAVAAWGAYAIHHGRRSEVLTVVRRRLRRG